MLIRVSKVRGELPVLYQCLGQSVVLSVHYVYTCEMLPYHQKMLFYTRMINRIRFTLDFCYIQMYRCIDLDFNFYICWAFDHKNFYLPHCPSYCPDKQTNSPSRKGQQQAEQPMSKIPSPWKHSHQFKQINKKHETNVHKLECIKFLDRCSNSVVKRF